tara:strand:+ start:371 stop:724 length:354 start_codon:yes stop_codon:yes gene_type:complete
MTGFGTYCPLHDWGMEDRECICDTRLTKPVATQKLKLYRQIVAWAKEVYEVGEEFDHPNFRIRVSRHDFSGRWKNSCKRIRTLGKIHNQKISTALKKHPDFEFHYKARGKIWYRRTR